MPKITRREGLGLALLPFASYAQSSLSFKGKRGIALYPWFNEMHRLDRPTPTLDDLLRVKKVGFDHVRIPIDPVTLNILAVINATELCYKAGLEVILNFHPHQMSSIEMMDKGLSLYLERLTRLVRAFKSLPVTFEPMNEPQLPIGSKLWEVIQLQLYQTIRGEAKAQSIILTCAAGSLLHGLDRHDPSLIQDENTLYTFHFYEPVPFTSQGASWMGEPYKSSRNIPYKGEKQMMLDHFGVAERWGKKHGIANERIYLGEFGLVKPFSKPEDQALWIKDVRETAEKYRFPWCFWNLFDVMGLAKNDYDRSFEPHFIKALFP